MHETHIPAGLDSRITHREVRIEADAQHLDKMLHRVDIDDEQGVKRHFTFYSDEPEPIGGEGNYPFPLHYFAGGIAF